MKLRISGLPASMDTPALRRLLQSFPGIEAAWVMRDPINFNSKRKGIILVDREANGLRIMQALEGRSLDPGKELKVEVVIPRI